jgi:hypothetical protein
MEYTEVRYFYLICRHISNNLIYKSNFSYEVNTLGSVIGLGVCNLCLEFYWLVDEIQPPVTWHMKMTFQKRK